MRILSILAVVVLAAAGCASREAGAYTMLRNEAVGDTSRVIVATFDANETEEFNHANCEHARELFQVEPTNRARFWCEKGRVRK